MERRFRMKVWFSEREDSVLVFESDSSSPASSSMTTPLDQDTWKQRQRQSRVDPRKRARDDAAQLLSSMANSQRYTDLLSGSFESPVDNCQDNINAFVFGKQDDARGLERYLSVVHKDERDGAREDVVEAVLHKQRQLLQKQRNGSSDGVANQKKRVQRRNSIQNDGRGQQSNSIVSDEERMEKLRSVSRRYSRPSRVFARRLGIADEMVVQRLDDSDDFDSDDDDEMQDESMQMLPMNPYLCVSRSNTNIKSLAAASPPPVALDNAKMVSRQPSIRELNLGIRKQAAAMNANKVSRQLSVTQLNVSIRNLAALQDSGSDFDTSNPNSNTNTNWKSNSNSNHTTNACYGSNTDSLIHPSMLPKHLQSNNCRRNNNMNTSRDRPLTLPCRPMRRPSNETSSSGCQLIQSAQIIQSALDLVDPSNPHNGEPEDEDLHNPASFFLLA